MTNLTNQIPADLLALGEYDKLNSFLQSDEKIQTPFEATELLCQLQSIVTHSRPMPFRFDNPNDCFCRHKENMMNFESSGESIRYIARAVLQAIADDLVGRCDDRGRS